MLKLTNFEKLFSILILLFTDIGSCYFTHLVYFQVLTLGNKKFIKV